MIKHVNTKEEFHEAIKEGKVLVDFFATWCGPCQMLAPLLEELSSQVTVVKVDVDELGELAREYAIQSIPTLYLFENGQVSKKSVGFLNKSQLQNFIA